MKGIFAARALSRELELAKTCDMFPEQYDVLYKSKQVGYARLRNGVFQVECPNCGGELVYMSKTINPDAGTFDDDSERKMNLYWAKLAISWWLLDNLAPEVIG